MAQITLTIPDATVGRVLASYGHWQDPVGQSTWVPAIPAEVRAVLMEELRRHTRAYEEDLAQATARAAVVDAL